MFRESSSLLIIDCNCSKVSRQIAEDIVNYVGRVNSECERFQLNQLSSDQSKTLVFVAGLTLSEEADIHTWLLSKADIPAEINIQELTEGYA